jgi:hypothetical protein
VKGLETEGKDVDEILEEVVAARRVGTDPKDMFGGKRGMVESGLPGAVAVIAVLYGKVSLATGAYLAIGTAVLFVLARLVRRDTLRHAFSGLVGVGVSIFFMWVVGDVKGFFLSGIIVNVVYGAVFLVSAVVGHPLVGVIMRLIWADRPNEWHDDPVVKRAYTEATLAWAGMFLLRVLVKGALYEADKTTLLAIAHFTMGYPLYVGVLGMTLPFVKKRTAGVPVPESAEGEAETGREDTENDAAEAVADGSGA